MKTTISPTVHTHSLRALCLALTLMTLASCVSNYPQPPQGSGHPTGPIKPPGSVVDPPKVIGQTGPIKQPTGSVMPPIKINPPKTL